ncbi:hypothetical protein ACLOJK_038871 [Asimina triloba]
MAQAIILWWGSMSLLAMRMIVGTQQAKVSLLVASVKEDEHQHHFGLEAENLLVKEHDAKAAIISIAKARMAKIDAELPSCKKIVEEREAIMIRD